MGRYLDLFGTTKQAFLIGLNGVRLKNSSGNLQIRNKADTDDADITAKALNITSLSLGGITLTPTGTELNYVAGVTSSIQTQLNAKQGSIGYTAENVANKDTDGTFVANSDTKYPSQKAVKTYSDTKLSPSGDGSSLTGLTKGQVGLGNVENTALSTWAGTTNITTLGTITTGTWHGTAIDDTHISSAATWNAKLSPSGDGSALTGLTKNQVGLGSVENTALSTWVGTANITTLGTIGTGTWNAGAVTIASGSNHTLSGGNLTVNGTYGSNMILDPGFDTPGSWTTTTGWTISGSKASHVATNLGTLTPNPQISAVVGTKYKIIYTVTNYATAGFVVTFGGEYQVTIAANGTYSQYVTASTTAGLIITPSGTGNGVFDIDTLSIVVVSNGVGTFENGVTANGGQFLGRFNDISYPTYSFADYPKTGMYVSATNQLGFSVNGAAQMVLAPGYTYMTAIIDLGGNGNLVLLREAAGILGLRNGVNNQTFNIYETYTDASNYSRLKINCDSTGYNFTASQLGTGINTRPFIFSNTRTLSAGITDGYDSCIRLKPGYSGAYTVTRFNYLDINDVTVASSAVVTDACTMRFDAAVGTHKALAAGSTKITPGIVDGWEKKNVNGTIMYSPLYLSMTT